MEAGSRKEAGKDIVIACRIRTEGRRSPETAEQIHGLGRRVA